MHLTLLLMIVMAAGILYAMYNQEIRGPKRDQQRLENATNWEEIRNLDARCIHGRPDLQRKMRQLYQEYYGEPW